MSKKFSLISPETTIAASGSYTHNPTDLPNCDTHIVKFISGTGTAKIEATSNSKGGTAASAVNSLATGLTAESYDTYVYKGAKSIVITETGGANSINVIIESYQV